MLPAIYFIFSRAACSDAAAACLDAGLRLTTAAERDRIREIVGARLRGIDDADLAVLGYARWMAGLEAGIAPHHAGLVPPFKEAVEACFVEGLVKVVFATETLALGINMPARSVVIEKLTKFTGERHQFLTPGEYTQLTGRAGRRGIDTSATRSCCGHRSCRSIRSRGWRRAARSGSPPRSARPTTWPPTSCAATRREQAHHLLNLSFGQYQADRDVVRLEARLERRREVLADLPETARRAPTATSTSTAAAAPRRERRPDAASAEAEIVASLARLKPGDVIMLHERASTRAGSRCSPSRSGAAGVCACASSRRAASSSRSPSPTSTEPVQRRRPRRPADSVRAEPAVLPARGRPPARAGSASSPSAPSRRRGPGRRDERRPTRSCATRQLDDRLRAAAQADRVAREVQRARGAHRQSGRLARAPVRPRRAHPRSLGLPRRLGAHRPPASDSPRIFHESDLLLAEAIGQGLLDDLDPGRPGRSRVVLHLRAPQPRGPARAVVPVARRCATGGERSPRSRPSSTRIEDEAGLDLTRPPEPTFLADRPRVGGRRDRSTTCSRTRTWPRATSCAT